MTFPIRPVLAALSCVAMLPATAQAATVFPGGTIFLSSDIITATSPTAFSGLTYGGTEARWTFDRRANDWVYADMYIFNASFSDGLTSEVRVNLEFGSVAAAQERATYYGNSIGQLPSVLRTDVASVWIHDGNQPFGGGNDSILIHDEQGVLYDLDGILEETLVHEATHTSLDPGLALSAGWLAAQAADPMYISPYARMYPDREDLAETFLMWLAVRHRPGSLTADQIAAIEQGIPNRLAFLDQQDFDLFPFLSVPEPGTWAMMILGMGMVGAGLRRRRSVRVAVRYS